MVIALLIVTAAALHGHLPADDRPLHTEPGNSRAALIFVVAALGGALAVLAVAIIVRLRDPRAPLPPSQDLSGMLGTGSGRPSWRVVLIGAGLLAAWLLLVVVLSRFVTGHALNPSAPPTDAPPPPSAPAPAQPAPKPPHRNDGGDMFGILLAAAVPAMLMIVAGSVVLSRRRRRAAVPSAPAAEEAALPTPPPTRSQTLARAAERGLAEMTDLSREPREAIIACYAAMERELARVPGAVPQDFDTPTEVLARAVERHALGGDNAVQLVNLFAEARFSPHVMNEGHRDLAAQVLRLVLDELQTRSVA
ncbi:hypothetical protein MPRM_26070 [Mycobacterium parmense]|uniref:Protein-glutamine gamma-glutamyltransferase-like C-terminal domain-containing protein n=1 Tax=Mycobacterium parmense TaxID=185642 RepID=A0A7I7YTW6_9MYCO|nr:hypothetical protein MPRM_26070 [Mycobacterium parmense]